MAHKNFTNRLREAETAGPLLVALLLVAWRFLHPGLAPFIRDEPILQVILDEEFAAHHVPLLGLMGSYGLRYGPTAMWFYLPLRLFTASASAIVVWHAASFVAAFGFFFAATRRTAGVLAASWATLLAASSPILFFYSRLAWDNTLFTLLSALLLHELVRLRAQPRPWRFAIFGTLCGLALNLHPMGTPVVAAALLCAWPALQSSAGSRGRNLAITLFPIFAQLVIYGVGLKLFWDKWDGRDDLSVHAPAGQMLQVLAKAVPGLLQFFTPASVRPFFGATLAAQLPFPIAFAFSTAGAAISAMLGWALVAAMGIRRHAHVATQFGVSSLLLVLAFFAVVRPDPVHPHYFTPCWWIGFYAFGLAIARARGFSRGVLQGLALLLVVTNVIFLGAMLGSVERNEGTRDLGYGTALRETERMTEELCGSMPEGSAVLHLDSVPGLTSPPIAYFAAHLPACQGRLIFYYPNVSPVLAALHYEVHYGTSSPDDASLVLNRMPPRRSSGRM